MQLPEGWRLGRATKGLQTLFYQDLWAIRVPVDEMTEDLINQTIANPPPRLYPRLYQEGQLVTTDEQGIRNLVKEDLITPEEAYNLCPTIRAWLRRSGLWSEDPVTTVLYNGTTYTLKGRDWYANGEALIKPAYFKSVWDARVAFAKGECSLHDVAEYSWGAVLEVIGDQAQLLPNYKRETRVAFASAVYFQINQIINAEPELCGFRKSESGLWIAVNRIVDLKNDPLKLRKFFNLLYRVLEFSISGYCARLIFTNADYRKIQWERRRWKINDHAVYIPYLAKKQDLIDACATLEDARTLVQTKQLEMIAIGAASQEALVTSFFYQGNHYGVYITSGKIFFISKYDEKFIPKDFDKWSEERQRNYLEEDYDKMVEDWIKRTKAQRRMYFYLKCCVGVAPRQAWKISIHKHTKIEEDFLKRRRAACRWTCYHVNKTAEERQIQKATLRLEAM